MMVARLVHSQYGTGYGTIDNGFFGVMVIYGFFLIAFIQLISTLLGDKSPVQVMIISKYLDELELMLTNIFVSISGCFVRYSRVYFLLVGGICDSFKI